MHQTKRGVLATTFSLQFPTFIIYCSCNHLRHCRLETKLLNNMGGAIHPPAVKEDRLGRRFQCKPHSFYFLIRRCFIGLGGDLSHHVSMSAASTRLAALVTTTYRHVG